MVEPLTDIERRIRFHTPHEINYAFESSVSFSAYSMYSKCPHQWHLNYGKRLAPFKSTIHTVFGSAFHEVFQSYLKTLYKESGIKADDMELVDMFNAKFREIYKIEYVKNNNTHFSSADEMREFFNDAVAILEFFKRNRRKYFQTRKIHLLGIELPLIYPVTKNVYMKGYIDFVLYDEDLDKILIFDIKTSNFGWSAKNKKDEGKTAQLILYKEYFAKQFQVDVEKIEVQFFIVKRKLYESEYTIPRIQTFTPASGKGKRRKVVEGFENFIKECYSNEGKPIDKVYHKNVSKNCEWCPFANTEHCDKKNV